MSIIYTQSISSRDWHAWNQHSGWSRQDSNLDSNLQLGLPYSAWGKGKQNET